MKKKLFQGVGHCPKCKSTSLSYGDSDLDGESLGYHFVCDDCGCTGTEWYNVVYDQTLIKE